MIACHSPPNRRSLWLPHPARVSCWGSEPHPWSSRLGPRSVSDRGCSRRHHLSGTDRHGNPLGIESRPRAPKIAEQEQLPALVPWTETGVLMNGPNVGARARASSRAR